jgi:type IV secretory pathway VirJ component
MARDLSSLDALVVGVDITHYLKEIDKSNETCLYTAGDFEELSKFVQKKLDFPRYITPVLVGCSSGATPVYATLIQAPFNTFRGAISLGFFPDLLLTKPLCKGSGLEWRTGPKGKGYSFLPAKTLEVPWIAFQGTIDQICDARATEAYVKQVDKGKLVLLTKVGHGFSVPKNWMTQFRKAFTTLIAKEDSNDRKYTVNELKTYLYLKYPLSVNTRI